VTTNLETLWEVRARAATVLAETLVDDVAGGHTTGLSSLTKLLLDRYTKANAELNERLDARKEVA
jgi:molybdenum-dependent DNA-binding transcriptional regulator ModE